MADREKVIYDIERCICHVPDACRDCSHYGNGEVIGCMEELLTDALTLLKEQEAKPMIENERGWNCPSCGLKLIGKTSSGYPCDLIDLPEDEPIHFCPMCGQAVKWE